MTERPVRPSACPQEDRVLSLAVEDPANPWLASHGASCPECAELIEVTRWASVLHEPASEAEPLPSAGQIWWKARLSARRAAEERALRPLRMAESAGVAVSILLAAACLAGIYRALPVILTEIGKVPSARAVLADPRSLGAMGLAAFIMTLAVRRLLARG
jgi:hypothetical protein